MGYGNFYRITENGDYDRKLNEEEKKIIVDISNCMCPNPNIPNWNNVLFSWHDGGQHLVFKPIGIWRVYWGGKCDVPEPLKFPNWEKSYVYYDLDDCDPFEQRFFPVKVFENVEVAEICDPDLDGIMKIYKDRHVYLIL